MTTVMTSEHAGQVLATGSGPSPWYFARSVPTGVGGSNEFTWADLDDRAVLHDAKGRARLVLNMYCYTRWIGPTRLLVWYATDHDLRFHLHDLDENRPDLIEYGIPRTNRERPIGLRAATAPTHTLLSIQLATAEGTHRLHVPAELRVVDELLFFTNAGKSARLWSVRCTDQQVTIVAQRWFNGGDYDHGYQWPTRAARDPMSRDVVAEGIRLGVFVLDPSCQDVAAWLIRDPFYHPARHAAS